MNNQSKQIIDSAYRMLADITAERLRPTVYRGLEKMPQSKNKVPLQWSQPGNVGNDHGASSKPHGDYTWFTSIPGIVTVLPAAAFDNFFFLLPFPVPQDLPNNFVLSFDNYSVAPDSLSATQALECQSELRDGINLYNMAWQLDQASKSLRMFNHIKGTWFNPKDFNPDINIPYPDISKPLSFKSEFRIDRAAQTTTHDSIWINGVQYQIEVTQHATPFSSSVELSTAFQIDPNSTSPVTAELSNISVAWL